MVAVLELRLVIVNLAFRLFFVGTAILHDLYLYDHHHTDCKKQNIQVVLEVLLKKYEVVQNQKHYIQISSTEKNEKQKLTWDEEW